jgi:hypothetical protein
VRITNPYRQAPLWAAGTDLQRLDIGERPSYAVAQSSPTRHVLASGPVNSGQVKVELVTPTSKPPFVGRQLSAKAQRHVGRAQSGGVEDGHCVIRGRQSGLSGPRGLGLLSCVVVDLGELGSRQDIEAEVAAPSAHSSCCSASTAPTSRISASRLGPLCSAGSSTGPSSATQTRSMSRIDHGPRTQWRPLRWPSGSTPSPRSRSASPTEPERRKPAAWQLLIRFVNSSSRLSLRLVMPD